VLTVLQVGSAEGRVLEKKIFQCDYGCSYIVAQIGTQTMISANVVRARVDTELKKEATAVLAKMGLSVSDAIRMMLVRVAAEQKLPFDVKVPNLATQEAMREADIGGGKRFDSVADLMADLENDDD
jgi:DNA-damage-inducible protein J